MEDKEQNYNHWNWYPQQPQQNTATHSVVSLTSLMRAFVNSMIGAMFPFLVGPFTRFSFEMSGGCFSTKKRRHPLASVEVERESRQQEKAMDGSIFLWFGP
jgi:hypothetical protein